MRGSSARNAAPAETGARIVRYQRPRQRRLLVRSAGSDRRCRAVPRQVLARDQTSHSVSRSRRRWLGLPDQSPYRRCSGCPVRSLPRIPCASGRAARSFTRAEHLSRRVGVQVQRAVGAPRCSDAEGNAKGRSRRPLNRRSLGRYENLRAEPPSCPDLCRNSLGRPTGVRRGPDPNPTTRRCRSSGLGAFLEVRE